MGAMAAPEIFVDTAGFFALWDASDTHHAEAVALQAKLRSRRRRLVTSDYVLDETITLLRYRHSHAAAVDFLSTIRNSRAIRINWIGSEIFDAAGSLFAERPDKEWSFTDCSSFVAMRRLHILDAFTTDHHFKQAGFKPLLRHSVG